MSLIYGNSPYNCGSVILAMAEQQSFCLRLTESTCSHHPAAQEGGSKVCSLSFQRHRLLGLQPGAWNGTRREREKRQLEWANMWCPRTCVSVCVCVCARSHKVAEVNSWGSVVHLQPDRTLLCFQCDLHKQVTQEAAAVRRGVHTLFPTHTQSYIYTHNCQVLKKVRTNRQRKEAGQVKDGDVVVKMMPVERLLNASGLCWRNNNNSN